MQTRLNNTKLLGRYNLQSMPSQLYSNTVYFKELIDSKSGGKKGTKLLLFRS